MFLLFPILSQKHTESKSTKTRFALFIPYFVITARKHRRIAVEFDPRGSAENCESD